MLFSKSFGYAIRGILYIAIHEKDRPRIQLNEMAKELRLPRHFMAKIMKKMAEEKIIDSVKGPYGGFAVNAHTFETSLIKIVQLTDGMETFNGCVLRVKKCNHKNPCPLHYEIEKTKNELVSVFSNTTIADLLKGNKAAFIRSITAF